VNAPGFSYDPYSPEAMRDPQSFYPVLREHHPAWFIPEYDTYVFSRYEDVWNGFLDSEHFSEAEMQLFSRASLLVHHRGNPPPPKIDPVKDMFLFLDPPVHTRFRRALAAPFLKGNVARLEPEITRIARERIAELLPRGRFDLNGDLGSHLSVTMTCKVMGIDVGDLAETADLVNRLVARRPAEPGQTPDAEIARDQLRAFLLDAVGKRRRGQGADSPAIDPLMGKDLIGRPLSDDEIATDLTSLLVGGTETLPKIFAGGLLELWKRPEQLAEVRAGMDDAIKPAFEEMLRYCAPAQWFGRTVKKRCELGGVMLEPGQRVILLIASANRDRREFDDPDEFIWNRKAKRMLSFGIGPHFCIGIHLARLEGQVLLREFLKAVGDFTPEPENGTWPATEFQVGWTSLPVRIG